MPTRREFLRISAAAAAAAAAGRAALAADGESRRKALERPMPMRDLGKTGLRVSCVALGCFPAGNLKDDDEGVAIVRRAHDLGVNWFDTAPSYKEGVSETRVGKALKGVRDRVFLATKSTCRDGKSARAELEGSLRRLQTDRVDLFQFHALKTAREAEAVFGEGGAFEAMLAARKEGKVLHLGFTGHFDPGLMAEVCRGRPVETVLVPLNCLDPNCTGPGEKSFVHGTLPAAREKGLGVLAMKVFASGRLLDDPAQSPSPEECVRYVLTLPVAAAVLGCGSIEELERDVAAAKTFEPMPKEEVEALLGRTRPLVARKIEWYKK